MNPVLNPDENCGENNNDFAAFPVLPKKICVAGIGNLLVKSETDESSFEEAVESLYLKLIVIESSSLFLVRRLSLVPDPLLPAPPTDLTLFPNSLITSS